jgi:putative membrane protein insertion efficiency factor
MPKRPPNSNARSGSPPGPEAPRPAAAVLLALIRGYQLLVRPLCQPSCRFAPSCSDYAREAVTRHGAVRGGLLALRRVGRCHPWHPGGWDPVPAEKS